MKKNINKTTSRHIFCILQLLNEINQDKKISDKRLQFIKRQCWFIQDDILQLIKKANFNSLEDLKNALDE